MLHDRFGQTEKNSTRAHPSGEHPTADTFAAVECMRYRPRRAYVRDFSAALIGAQRPAPRRCFAFGGISPLRHDPDIVRRLALGKCVFG